MIKKIFIVLVIIVIMGVIGAYESTYTRNAIIINSENGIVTAQDNCGYIWEYKGFATIGDNVLLVMSDNHTSKITDDIIKGIRQYSKE